MAKVFVTQKGAVIEFGSFGAASLLQEAGPDGKPGPWVEKGVEIPESVADELEREIAGQPPDPQKGTAGRPGRTDIRVERASAPAYEE